VAVQDKNLDAFMTCLAENIKNLAVRVKQLVKKVEKTLQAKISS